MPGREPWRLERSATWATGMLPRGIAPHQAHRPGRSGRSLSCRRVPQRLPGGVGSRIDGAAPTPWLHAAAFSGGDRILEGVTGRSTFFWGAPGGGHRTGRLTHTVFTATTAEPDQPGFRDWACGGRVTWRPAAVSRSPIRSCRRSSRRVPQAAPGRSTGPRMAPAVTRRSRGKPAGARCTRCSRRRWASPERPPSASTCTLRARRADSPRTRARSEQRLRLGPGAGNRAPIAARQHIAGTDVATEP